jgi:thioredoxin reductase
MDIVYRAIALPEGAKTDQARAEFQNGVLKISVPAPQPQSNARQIPIEAGASQSKSESQPAKSQTAGQTTQKAVFAAGDVRHRSVKRCPSAVGEGALAVTFVHRYVMNG